MAGVLLLAYKYFDDGVGEAIIVNANLGGDSCHRGALLGALLGAAGLSLPSELRDGLHNAQSTARATEAYLGVLNAAGAGQRDGLLLSLAPKPDAAVASEAAACSS